MPSVGFKLFADTSAFERGLATSAGSTRKLKEVVGDLGGVLKHTFAATAILGVVAAIKAATSHAQELRSEAEKVGKTLDANTAAAARLGDALGSAKGGALCVVNTGLVQTIGLLARIGEAMGAKLAFQFGGFDALARIGMNASKEDHIRTLEGGEESANKVGEERKKNTYDEASDQQKVNLLLADNLRIKKEQAKFEFGSAEFNERQLVIEQNNRKIHDVEVAIKKEKVALVEREGKLVDAGARRLREDLPVERQILAVQSELTNLLQLQKSFKVDSKGYVELAEKIEKAKDDLHGLHKEENELLETRKTEQGKLADLESQKDQADNDESKLTLKELSNIAPFTPGVSTGAEAQGEQARQARDYQRQAEQARLGGDTAGYMDLKSRAYQIINGRLEAEDRALLPQDRLNGGLTMLRSSERGPKADDGFAAIVAVLGRIESKLNGKIVNQ